MVWVLGVGDKRYLIKMWRTLRVIYFPLNGIYVTDHYNP